MKNEKSSYGLILSSIVGVVALVGLVMLFGSHATGASTTYAALNDCPFGVYGLVSGESGAYIGCISGVAGKTFGYANPAQGSMDWDADKNAAKWDAPEGWGKEEFTGELQPGVIGREGKFNTGSLS